MQKKHFILILFSLLLSLNLYSQDDLIKIIDENKQEVNLLLKKFEYDKIPSILEESLNISNQIDIDSVTVKVYEMHAKFYHFTSNFDKAAFYLMESAKMYEELGYTVKALKMYNNISIILNRNKQYEASLKIRKKILKSAIQEKDYWLIATTLTNLAPAYRRVKKMDSCFYYLYNAIDYSKKHNFRDLVGSNYKSLQKTFLDNEEYAKSLKFGDTVQLYYKNDINREIYENSITFSAQALYELKQFDASIKKSELAINLINESGRIVSLSSPYELLSLAYSKKKNYKKALEYKIKQIQIKDSILNIDRQKAIIELEQKFETEKKEKENLQLKQESAVKDLTISNKNNTILWSFLGFITILSLLVSYQLRKTKRANKKLEKAIHSKEVLEEELTTVRTNIAQDFHDDLGNKLARISIFSQLLSEKLNPKHDKEKSMLSHIITDTNYLYKGTRDFIFSLKAESDYVEELATYLSDFGEDYFKEFNIDFEIEKQIDTNEKLPYYWSKQLIYIFKEAMTNVAKHANATKVNFSFIYKNKELEISCTDNGKGFDCTLLKSDNGLANMKERAEKIKGNIEINSTKNNTIIKFVGKTTS